jgi:hypothetical protein
MIARARCACHIELAGMAAQQQARESRPSDRAGVTTVGSVLPIVRCSLERPQPSQPDADCVRTIDVLGFVVAKHQVRCGENFLASQRARLLSQRWCLLSRYHRLVAIPTTQWGNERVSAAKQADPEKEPMSSSRVGDAPRAAVTPLW